MNTAQGGSIAELHVFPHRESYLAFHSSSFSLFRISGALFKAIEELQHGAEVSQAARTCGIREDDLVGNLHKIQEKVDRGRASACPPGLESSRERPMALSLHVSNACNLRCVYCYADGGSYGRQPRAKMDKELAVRSLETMYRNFADIDSITFFGGEPALAMDVIELVCRHVKELHARGKAARIPEYSIVTNGTLINDEAIRIIREHKIQVTISVDGPLPIHDQLRPKKDGTGTYRIVKQGFDRIVAEIGQVPKIEATYTRAHLQAGMRMEDLANFLQKEFLFRVGAIVPVHVATGHPVALSDDETNSEIGNFSRALIQGLIKDDSPKLEHTLLAPIMFFLSRRSTRYMCPVGRTRLTITTDGEIYPCHRLMDPSFLMGTVYDFDYAHPSEQLRRALDRLTYCDKDRNPLCQNCWVKPFCVACPGSDIFASNDYRVPERFCKEMGTFIESSLTLLYEIKSDLQAWPRFLTGLQRLSADLRKQTPGRLRTPGPWRGQPPEGAHNRGTIAPRTQSDDGA